MDMVYIIGLMVQSMMVIGTMERYLASVSTPGLKEKSTEENGKTITCMVLAFKFGLMEELIQVSLETTRKMDMESTSGKMVASMKVSGSTLSSMVWAPTRTLKTAPSLVFGRLERE
jgi:hypothetical protein